MCYLFPVTSIFVLTRLCLYAPSEHPRPPSGPEGSVRWDTLLPSVFAPFPSAAAAAAAAVAATALAVVLLVVLLGAAAFAFVILAVVIFGWGVLVATALGVKGAATFAVAAEQRGEEGWHGHRAREASVARRADANHPVVLCLANLDESVAVPALAIASITQWALDAVGQVQGHYVGSKYVEGKAPIRQ